MKKHTSSISRSLPPVKLYVDDLNKILFDLNEIGAEASSVFMTGGMEYADVAEMLAQGSVEFSELSIHAKNGVWTQIILRFAPNSVFLHVMEDTATNIGVLTKIEETLRLRRTPYAQSFILLYASAIVGIINMVGNSLALFFHVSLPVGFIIFSAALNIILLLSSIYLRRISLSSITLKHRADAPSFWAKNRDAIVVNMFVAILAVVLTLVGEVLLRK